jgi:hypothetical protein
MLTNIAWNRSPDSVLDLPVAMPLSSAAMNPLLSHLPIAVLRQLQFIIA